MTKLLSVRTATFLLIILVVSGFTAFKTRVSILSTNNDLLAKHPAFSQAEIEQIESLPPVSFEKDIKPILDSRCTTCHSCYDSPCQLKLSSSEGLQRGASQIPVYDHARLKAQSPTRLFIDETTTKAWRDKGFYPVINEQNGSSNENLNLSLIARFLKLKRSHPLPEQGKLPDDFDLELQRTLECPTPVEFIGFQKDHPLWGMPYGMPGLSERQENVLLKWLQEGAKIEPRPALSSSAQHEIKKWETFFNDPTPKSKLTSRYIYEHLFIGHLHFKGHPDTEFYKLVRSKTPTGQTIEEIKTVRPFDDPGTETFYYRLRPIVSTIVDKNHFVYELSDARMQRYRELFLAPDYQITELPGYQPELTANPFNTFKELPAGSRYQFLLDEARYFFDGFIKGPVCRGQGALNVIRDQFWVAFLKPEQGFMQKTTHFLEANNNLLSMPASAGEDIGFTEWRQFGKLEQKYLTKKEQFLEQTLLDSHPLDYDLLWDGDKNNDNALLTVFRHYDSATVIKGLAGKPPLTAWVVDYPIFERIHYLLVAGFNVFGSAGHQITTRLYMDFLRMEAENNFLRFIPAELRQTIHDTWYQGIETKLFKNFETPLYSINTKTGIEYPAGNFVENFFSGLFHQLAAKAGPEDNINRCWQNDCIASLNLQKQIASNIRRLSDLYGEQISALPELSFLRIRFKDPEQDQVYTLIRNKRLSNVSFIFAEDFRRQPEKDTLTVLPGFIGSYPNVFFSVPADELEAFVTQLKQTRSQSQKDNFYSRFGIRRTNPQIWEFADWFNQKHLSANPLETGIFDLNRYENL